MYKAVLDFQVGNQSYGAGQEVDLKDSELAIALEKGWVKAVEDDKSSTETSPPTPPEGETLPASPEGESDPSLES